ncbi:hypothetical protein HII31_08496 [Pseudocercospora fuligena]|uniref:Uncharacterized protein n=1 Tax=Pseudocercospora fuligena TaxID=685502 RepID=A0A8H6VG41_9PEZI|nr:hypothetical protein HII31_08496 [Pseudocercospora fuligena]
MANTRFQHYGGETDSYTRYSTVILRMQTSANDSSSPSVSSPRQQRDERRMTTSTFVKHAERLAANYQEDITKKRLALGRSTKRIENLLNDIQITERNRDLAFDQILEEMEQKGLPTEAVEAVISRALVAPDRALEPLPCSKTKGRDYRELGRMVYYCIFVPLVCCLWFGVFMAIRDGKLSWQTIAMLRKWLIIHWYAYMSCGQTEACDRWQVIKSFLDVANAKDRILWVLM